MTTMLDEALAYAARGLKVFPLIPGTKEPDVPWKDVATTDAAIIKQWWEDRPAANIGLPCQINGLVVVDMDRNHGDGTVDGIESWCMLLDSLGVTALDVATLAAWTPNGGLHYVYRVPHDATLRGKLAAGIDIKYNGYIVAAPSILSVGVYYWDDVPGAPTEPALCPPLLWAAMQKVQHVPSTERQERTFVPPGEAARYVQVALERECADLASSATGNRNTRLNLAAFNLGKYVGSGALSASAVVDALMDAARASGLVDEDGDHAARSTLRSGLTAGQRFPKDVPEGGGYRKTTTPFPPSTPPDAPPPESFPDTQEHEPPREKNAPLALHSRDAEMGVLGVLMRDPEQFVSIAAITEANDYYVSTHKQMFKAMEYLWTHKTGIDPITVADRLIAMGHGAVDMDPFLSKGDAIRDLPACAEIVAEKAIRRRLIQAARDLEKMALSGMNQEAIREKAQSTLFSIGMRDGRQGSQHISIAADRRIAEMRELHRNPNSRVGIDTGIRGLDKLTGGFRPGQLWVLIGDTGGGKTSLAMSMVRNVAYEGHSVVMYSLEMSDGDLYDRWQSMDGGVDSLLAQTGPLSDRDLAEAEKAYSAVRALPIFVGEASTSTLPSMRADIQRRVASDGVRLVIVDYFQLMIDAGGEKTSRETRAQILTEISRGLKLTAMETGVCILGLAQVNRAAVGSTRPTKDNISDTSAFAKDASFVLVVSPKNPNDANENLRNLFEIYIDKARTGPQKVGVEVVFTPHRTFFGDRAWGHHAHYDYE